MKSFTMITRHGSSKDSVSAYTLISADYQTVTVSDKELAKAIKSGKMTVNNMALDKTGLVSTNGALSSYTFINSATGAVEGTPKAVILDRVEQKGKLVGYTVFTQNGTIAELNIADAAALANQKMIANGKVRHTSEGDIVSAIGGNYTLRTIEIAKAPKGEITVDILYFGTTVGTSVEYFGAIVSCTSATEMSKLTDVLSKSNAKVVNETAKVAGQSVRESLAIKRMGANSLYGVFSIDMLDKLVKAGGHINNKVGSMTVSAVKYSKDGVDEATVKLDKSWKVVSNDTTGSEAATAVKNYTKKIVTKYSTVEVK